MLLGRGIRKGQKVAILLMNCLEWLPIYFGIVALFFVPNLFLGCRAMCHCICWMAPFMVLGEKLGSALRFRNCASRPIRMAASAAEVRPRVSDEPAGARPPGRRCRRRRECIQCAACADVCPKGVLRLRMGRMR